MLFLRTLLRTVLRVDLRAVDEGEFISGLQKIANRITQGLIFAGLTVSAALMMRVDTGFKIFGYSGLALLVFHHRRRLVPFGLPLKLCCTIEGRGSSGAYGKIPSVLLTSIP